MERGLAAIFGFVRTHLTDWTFRRLDNAHLLDATEIFRKLNVHKKVRIPFQMVVEGRLQGGSSWGSYRVGANLRIGIFHQAWLPLGYVLLLSLFDDSGSYKR